MKVEKCPRCKQIPIPYVIVKPHSDRIFAYERMCPKCEKSVTALTKNGAVRKWNRWARREAKRIAKEGATK